MYAVMGNHDYFGHAGGPVIEMLNRCSIKVLENTHCIEEKDGAQLVIAGVDDTWSERTASSRTASHEPSRTAEPPMG